MSMMPQEQSTSDFEGKFSPDTDVHRITPISNISTQEVFIGDLLLHIHRPSDETLVSSDVDEASENTSNEAGKQRSQVVWRKKNVVEKLGLQEESDLWDRLTRFANEGAASTTPAVVGAIKQILNLRGEFTGENFVQMCNNYRSRLERANKAKHQQEA